MTHYASRGSIAVSFLQRCKKSALENPARRGSSKEEANRLAVRIDNVAITPQRFWRDAKKRLVANYIHAFAQETAAASLSVNCRHSSFAGIRAALY